MLSVGRGALRREGEGGREAMEKVESEREGEKKEGQGRRWRDSCKDAKKEERESEEGKERGMEGYWRKEREGKKEEKQRTG